MSDFTAKRRRMGAQASEHAGRIVEGLRALIAIGAELPQCGGGFTDEDCIGDLAHTNAYQLNVLTGIVAPALQTSTQALVPETSLTLLDILYAVKPASSPGRII